MPNSNALKNKRLEAPSNQAKSNGRPTEASPPTKVLSIDIGGSKIKILLAGENEPRKIPSGKKMTPNKMIEAIAVATEGWDYEAVSIGYPGLVGPTGPRSEPGNLGPGWVGFNYGAALGRPVRIVNDAAMQALGSYEGGRMLFLGLGTGLGSTFISDNVIMPLELGRVLYQNDQRLGDVLGKGGLEKMGKDAWRSAVHKVVSALTDAFVADYVVLGGGNAKLVKDIPPGTRRGHNLTAFRGGLRLWNVENVATLNSDGAHEPPPRPPGEWRIM